LLKRTLGLVGALDPIANFILIVIKCGLAAGLSA
jgi:hypothetical protein